MLGNVLCGAQPHLERFSFDNNRRISIVVCVCVDIGLDIGGFSIGCVCVFVLVIVLRLYQLNFTTWTPPPGH